LFAAAAHVCVAGALLPVPVAQHDNLPEILLPCGSVGDEGGWDKEPVDLLATRVVDRPATSGSGAYGDCGGAEVDGGGGGACERSSGGGTTYCTAERPPLLRASRRRWAPLEGRIAPLHACGLNCGDVRACGAGLSSGFAVKPAPLASIRYTRLRLPAPGTGRPPLSRPPVRE